MPRHAAGAAVRKLLPESRRRHQVEKNNEAMLMVLRGCSHLPESRRSGERCERAGQADIDKQSCRRGVSQTQSEVRAVAVTQGSGGGGAAAGAAPGGKPVCVQGRAAEAARAGQNGLAGEASAGSTSLAGDR